MDLPRFEKENWKQRTHDQIPCFAIENDMDRTMIIQSGGLFP